MDCNLVCSRGSDWDLLGVIFLNEIEGIIMIMISMIGICIVALFLLAGMAFLICFIGTQTESVPYVMIAILVGFFLSYIVLDFTCSILTEVYNLPPFFWEQNVEARN